MTWTPEYLARVSRLTLGCRIREGIRKFACYGGPRVYYSAGADAGHSYSLGYFRGLELPEWRAS